MWGVKGGGQALGVPTPVSAVDRACAPESQDWDFLSLPIPPQWQTTLPPSTDPRAQVGLSESTLCQCRILDLKGFLPLPLQWLRRPFMVKTPGLLPATPHPKTKESCLESWQGLGVWWFVAPPPETDDFCLMLLSPVQSVEPLASLPAVASCSFLAEQNRGICRFYARPLQQLITIWYSRRAQSTVVCLLHPPTSAGPARACTTHGALSGLLSIPSPDPSFLWTKSCFRESKLSLCLGLPGILNYHASP